MALANCARRSMPPASTRTRRTWTAARSCATRTAGRPASSRTTRWRSSIASCRRPSRGDARPRARRRDDARRRAGRHRRAPHGRLDATSTAFTRAHGAGRLRTRIYAAVPLADWDELRDRGGRRRARRRLAADRRASRASSTARWARTPRLFDARSPTRRTTAASSSPTPERLRAWIAGADDAGLHVVVHAIGDRANRELARHL